MITGYPWSMYKNIIWNTGPAAMLARLKNKKRKKNLRLQAPSQGGPAHKVSRVQAIKKINS